MSLKNLQLTEMPARGSDPVANRRKNLVERLEEQKVLAADPTFLRRSTHRRKGEMVEVVQKVRPWTRLSPTGQMVLALLVGGKPLDLDGKGNTAVVIPSRDKVVYTLDQIIEAVSTRRSNVPSSPVSRPRRSLRTRAPTSPPRRARGPLPALSAPNRPLSSGLFRAGLNSSTGSTR